MKCASFYGPWRAVQNIETIFNTHPRPCGPAFRVHARARSTVGRTATSEKAKSCPSFFVDCLIVLPVLTGKSVLPAFTGSYWNREWVDLGEL
jgi:hypothetical protein